MTSFNHVLQNRKKKREKKAFMDVYFSDWNKWVWITLLLQLVIFSRDIRTMSTSKKNFQSQEVHADGNSKDAVFVFLMDWESVTWQWFTRNYCCENYTPHSSCDAECLRWLTPICSLDPGLLWNREKSHYQGFLMDPGSVPTLYIQSSLISFLLTLHQQVS